MYQSNAVAYATLGRDCRVLMLRVVKLRTVMIPEMCLYIMYQQNKLGAPYQSLVLDKALRNLRYLTKADNNIILAG